MEKSSKKKWKDKELDIAIVISGIGFLVFHFITVYNGHQLKQDGIYSMTKSIELYRNTKSGKEYIYKFKTSQGEEVAGSYFISRLSRKNIDLNKAYYVAYSQNDPALNDLLISKRCCDSLLLFQKIEGD